MRYRFSIVSLVLLGMALCVGTVHAQEQQISGTVTSADDQAPLPGANVSVPGTTIGTATNAQGQYSLRVPTDADSLRFSFVGFQEQTVAIAGRTTIDIALAPRAQQIEELGIISKLGFSSFNRCSEAPETPVPQKPTSQLHDSSVIGRLLLVAHQKSSPAAEP